MWLCEKGSIFQRKVNEKDTFSVKNGRLNGYGLDWGFPSKNTYQYRKNVFHGWRRTKIPTPLPPHDQKHYIMENKKWWHTWFQVSSATSTWAEYKFRSAFSERTLDISSGGLRPNFTSAKNLSSEAFLPLTYHVVSNCSKDVNLWMRLAFALWFEITILNKALCASSEDGFMANSILLVKSWVVFNTAHRMPFRSPETTPRTYVKSKYP